MRYDLFFDRNKKYFFLLFLLCLTTLIQTVNAQNANSLIKKGQREYEDNNVEAALEYFEQALSKERNNYTAAYFAGVSYLRLSFPKKALDRLSIVRAERFRLTKDVYYWQAYANFKNGKFEKATELIALHRGKYKSFMDEEIAVLEQNINSSKDFYNKDLQIKVENLGNNINSENPEYSAVLTNDHRTIKFTTRRKENKGGEKSGEFMEDILTSTLNENDQWEKAKRLKGLVTVGHDATVQLFGDDKKMIIYQKKDLFITELENGRWSSPKSIGKEINKAKSRESHGFISKDGKTLIFSSDYKSKEEDLNLFISRKLSNGEWGKPRPLQELNTERDEDSPFIADDGTLYFSSKGHNSMGGFDIFKSEYNPTTRKFGAPVNMGYPLNSVSDDIFFNVKNGIAYFTSNRAGGLGREDIYRAYLFESININLDFVYQDSEEPISNAVVYLELKDERIALKTDISGNVKSVIPAFQDFKIQLVKDGETLIDKAVNPLTSLKDPTNFYAKIEVGQTLEEIITETKEEIVAVKEVNKESFVDGIVQENREEDSPSQSLIKEKVNQQQQVRELDAKFKSTTGRFVLKRIYFDHDKSILKPESFNELDNIVAYLKQNTGIRAEIGGHTDNVGPIEYNDNLSQRRAQAVVNYLIENGIESNRLEAKGYGETKPLVSNDDEREGREINRRIELKVLSEASNGFSKN